MNAIRDTEPGIPANGFILRYLIRAVGLPTKAIEGVSDKALQRLSVVELNDGSAARLIARLFDELLQSDAPDRHTSQILAAANDRCAVGGPFAERWMEDENGEVILDRVELTTRSSWSRTWTLTSAPIIRTNRV